MCNAPQSTLAESPHGQCEEISADGNCEEASLEWIMRQDPQKALGIIMEVYHLTLPEIPNGNEDFSGIAIGYNPHMGGDGRTFVDDGKIIIELGRAAFAHSPGWLGSTIYHELCHAQQMLGPTCQSYRRGGFRPIEPIKTEGPRKYALPTQGGAMNEVEAYDLELSMVEYFGLTTNEVARLETGKLYYYSALNEINQGRASHHNYFCEEETCNWQADYKY